MNKKIIALFVGIAIVATAISAAGRTIENKKERNIGILSYNYEDVSFPEIDILSSEQAVINLIQQINESMVLKYYEELSVFGPRVTDTEGCRKAAEYAYNEFEEYGLSVRYHNWTTEAISGSNVEATLEGTDSSSDYVYIISAHYDTVPESLGIFDNSAGTVTTLLAAKIISQYNFDYTIRFVLFSGEEQGLLGSYAYAKEARKNKDNIQAVLNVDAYGYDPDEKNTISVYDNPRSHWITESTIEVSNRFKEYINLEAIPVTYLGAVSDNYCFWQFRYDSVTYIDTELLPDVHTPGDNLENLKIEQVVQVSRLSIATLIELSSNSFSINNNLLYVDSKGTAAYTTITDAVNDAEAGDTVYVYNGTYEEKINIDKSINLIGESKETTMIKGKGEAVLFASAAYTYISGFNIGKNESENPKAGIKILSNNNIITENKIADINGYGIGILGYSHNNVSNNDIINNNDGFISWYKSTYNIISGNKIIDNEVAGVALSGQSDYNTMEDNDISGNYFGVYFQMGLYEGIHNPSNNIITKNKIVNNTNGIYFNIVSKENTISYNQIEDNELGIFLGTGCNKNIIKKNNFVNNTKHAFFSGAIINRYIRNYYNDHNKLRPKAIIGEVTVAGSPMIPFINLDLFPAKRPHEI